MPTAVTPHEPLQPQERDRIKGPPTTKFRRRNTRRTKFVRQCSSAAERSDVNVESIRSQTARQYQQLRRPAGPRERTARRRQGRIVSELRSRHAQESDD